jgi:hypothetical protein
MLIDLTRTEKIKIQILTKTGVIMVFKETKYGDVSVVSINCATTVSIHANNFKEYLNSLLTSGRKKVVVDCREAVYIDSSFIGSLVISYKNFLVNDGELKIVCSDTHGHFWSFFQVTKVFSQMKSYSDLLEAVDAFETEMEKVA